MIKRMQRHRVKNWKIWINKEKGNCWRKSFSVENEGGRKEQNIEACRSD